MTPSNVAAAEIRVLVIDDNPGQLRTLCAIVADEGLAVTGCATGKEGLEHLGSEEAEIAIVDLNLPDISEEELLESLAGVAQRVSIILNTGYASLESARKAVNVGVFAFVEKGSDPAELVLQVHRAVEVQLRHRAELALREQSRLNELLLNSLPYPAMLIRKDRTITAANRLALDAGARIGGFCWQEFGRSEFIAPDAKKRLAEGRELLPGTAQCTFCQMDEAFARRKAMNAPDVRAWDKVWSTFWIPLDENLFLHYAIDVTEHRRADEMLHQADKMNAIGQLAGGIAHDFNNQLTGVLGYAEMLANRLEDKNLCRYAENIRKAATRAVDLTGQLLAFARKGHFINVTMDIHRTIADVVALVEHSVDKRVRIRQHLVASPSVTLGDPTQLQGALLNLALNAGDAMPRGGDLSFATDVVMLDEAFLEETPFDIAPGQYLKVTVADTGCGIDEETRKHIFEPFFTTKEIGKGTGMGLAGVYGAVERHKGTITVQSQKGKGSTFTLYLPSCRRSEVGPAPAPKLDQPKGTAHVLVVDDEDIVREIAGEILRELGYQVTIAKDGKEAVDCYQDSWSDIDLVLLDLSMPRMDGHDTFVAMQKINPEVKVIVSSGYDLTSEVKEIMAKGVRAFIRKPYKQGELSQKVVQVLRGGQ